MSKVILKADMPQKVVLKSELTNGSTAALEELLVVLNWESGKAKDLDIVVLFKKKGQASFLEDVYEPNSSLHYQNTVALNGKAHLSADNRDGTNRSPEAVLSQAAVTKEVIDKLKHIEVDEAFSVDLTEMEKDHTEAYISVVDYNNTSFSKAEKIDITFYNAKTGDQVGDAWTYNENLQGNASGFIIGKIVKPSDAWEVTSSSHPIVDEDSNGVLTVLDVAITINKKGI